MTRILKCLKHALLLILLLTIQIAIICNLHGAMKHLNFILVVLVFIAVVDRFYLAVIYALILGFALEQYSVLPFGAINISLLLTLYVLYKIFARVLTNKSFYALIGLTLLATVIANFIIYIYSSIIHFEATKDILFVWRTIGRQMENLSWQLLMNTLAVTAVFVIFHLSSKRFKAVFIDTIKT